LAANGKKEVCCTPYFLELALLIITRLSNLPGVQITTGMHQLKLSALEQDRTERIK